MSYNNWERKVYGLLVLSTLWSYRPSIGMGSERCILSEGLPERVEGVDGVMKVLKSTEFKSRFGLTPSKLREIKKLLGSDRFDINLGADGEKRIRIKSIPCRE